MTFIIFIFSSLPVLFLCCFYDFVYLLSFPSPIALSLGIYKAAVSCFITLISTVTYFMLGVVNILCVCYFNRFFMFNIECAHEITYQYIMLPEGLFSSSTSVSFLASECDLENERTFFRTIPEVGNMS